MIIVALILISMFLPFGPYSVTIPAPSHLNNGAFRLIYYIFFFSSFTIGLPAFELLYFFVFLLAVWKDVDFDIFLIPLAYAVMNFFALSMVISGILYPFIFAVLLGGMAFGMTLIRDAQNLYACVAIRFALSFGVSLWIVF